MNLLNEELKDNIARWLANHLPRRIAYYAAVRVATHAGMVQTRKPPSEIYTVEALRLWNRRESK